MENSNRLALGICMKATIELNGSSYLKLSRNIKQPKVTGDRSPNKRKIYMYFVTFSFVTNLIIDIIRIICVVLLDNKTMQILSSGRQKCKRKLFNPIILC